jgi:hypothetical protein
VVVLDAAVLAEAPAAVVAAAAATGVLVAGAAAAATTGTTAAAPVALVVAVSGAAVATGAAVTAAAPGETATQNPPKARAVRPASAQRAGALARFVVRRARAGAVPRAVGDSWAAAGAPGCAGAVRASCVGIISLSMADLSVPRTD